ncbi:MAG: anthranilate phosphoribosyltransferase [Methylococcales bacterium]|jgi:anthranilate phosphoribosyltransferase|nr:anthranilate phosphoribosyltransferase [Methylococcales bacterium]MBT3815048.1 anthranilate phosphoribosyltransferase [Methylococcales bacterium]MBT4031325.1 anthranilate phosphoribosyltransferase [Methylococcales bacterium]MBT4347737.1 anthranilate phosphoribosyltransferase [Methylococcales bacterium]MBT4599648.1 anthranilate phosphoribosyltransferase [Methylococcales bacterium]
MDMPKALNLLLDGQDLNPDQMHAVMHLIMTGKATPAQIAGFLIALRLKGETVSEIAAAANVMRELATPVTITGQHVIDTCGTGGDGANTFNISTTVAFVVAAAGGQVAKHGNRSVSSRSGSADVLEAAGVNLDLSAEQVSQCVNTIGVGFLFAPKHHSAMKHTIGPRKEMAVRTIFNLLGPLSNPAGAKNQLIGVFSEQWVEPLAQVLHKLGSEHVLIVNAEDGLDEISINSATTVAELQNGSVRTYSITPEQFGFQRAPLSTLAVDSIQSSLDTLKKVLRGEPGPAKDIVCLNAGAAIYAANLTDTLDSGIQKAQHIIDNGVAFEKLEQLCLISNRL